MKSERSQARASDPAGEPRGALRSRHAHEPPGRGDEPVPAPARAQPGGLASLGCRGAGAGARRGPPDLPVGRLRRLPLVPRDGARVLRRCGHGGLPQRELREHQGGSRGAAGPRCDLHARRAGLDRVRRMADDRLPDPRRSSLLWRHVLSECQASRAAVLPRRPGRGLGSVAGAACRRRARRDGSHVVARTDRAPRRRGRAGRDRHPRCGRVRAGVRLRRRGCGMGRPDEVPPADGPGVPAPPRGVRRRPLAAAGPPHAGPDGGRGNPRPAGWRVQPLRHGAHLAGAPLREDALRQRPARAHLPARLAADRQSGRPGRGPLHARLRGARDDPARRRLCGEPRCGHGRRGGCDLHLDVRRDPRCAGRSRPGGGCRAVRGRVRRDRRGELGGSHDSPAGSAGRGAGGSDGLPRGRGSVAPRRGPPGAPGGPGPAAAARPRRQGPRRLERADAGRLCGCGRSARAPAGCAAGGGGAALPGDCRAGRRAAAGRAGRRARPPPAILEGRPGASRGNARGSRLPGRRTAGAPRGDGERALVHGGSRPGGDDPRPFRPPGGRVLRHGR